MLFTDPSRQLNVGVTGWDCDATGEKFVLVIPPRVQTANSVEVVTDFSSLVSRK
jgi:hypothetical protein